MKKMRTLVVMHESLVPPENLEGHTDKEIEEWRTEYDVTTTLRKSGHDVRCMGVLDSLTELRSAIADWKPDVVFNLLEEFNGIVTYDQHVVAFLELMRQPYTGCNPRGLLLVQYATGTVTLRISLVACVFHESCELRYGDRRVVHQECRRPIKKGRPFIHWRSIVADLSFAGGDEDQNRIALTFGQRANGCWWSRRYSGVRAGGELSSGKTDNDEH